MSRGEESGPGPEAGRSLPTWSLEQLAALDLVDEPCHVVDLATAATLWLNAAAKAVWGLHDVVRLAVAPASMARLREVRVGRAEIALHCDGLTRTLVRRFKPIRLAGGQDAVLLLDLPAAHGAVAPDPSTVSEERLRDFATVASDWFWETDAEGRFTYVSPSVGQASGERPEDIVGRTREQIAKASGRAEAMAEIEPILAAVAQRRPFADIVVGRLRTDGQMLQVSSSGRPYFDAAGNFLGYRGCGRNISPQIEAERRLDDSEQRFRDFAETASDWFYELDSELRFSFISPHAQERTGEEVAALIGRRPTRDGLVGVSDEAWQAHEADLAARRMISDFRFAMTGPDGALRHFSVSAKPVFDRGGAFRGYRGSGRDMTALVEAERFLRQVVDSMPAAIAVRDAEMRYVLANVAFARQFGTTPDAVVGKITGAYLGQEAAARVTARDRQVFADGRPVGPFEMRIPNAAGESRQWQVDKVPLHSAGGKVRAVLTVGTDITALKQIEAELIVAQKRLADGERRFRDFAEISSDVTWEMGPDLRLTYISDGIEPITGYPAAWYIGRRNVDLGADDPRREAIERMLEARRTIREYPFSRPLPNGRVVHLVYGAKPIFADDGAFLGYRGTIRDITAQREAEIETDRLRKVRDLAAVADIAKTRFLGNMSHELRTPLNAILGFAEIMSGEMLGPLGTSAYRDYARDIETSGRHLLAIISDLLDMSRIQLDEFRIVPAPVDIAALAGECVAAAQAEAAPDVAPVVVMPIHPDWVLDVDRRALGKVLTKLLSNALKFTPAGGRIAVELRQDRGDTVTLAVSDTGCGIAAERMATLFEPFQRSGSQLSRGGCGAGLGLWVSRALVELHGGTLTVASTEGQGTVVSATFPGMRIRRRPPRLRIAS